jgi:transcriptional regulator with XRE-family HTH domain
MTVHELKAKRMNHGITARLVAPRAGLSSGRLSDIERGYIAASKDELVRISRALDELIAARQEIQAVAKRVGWPVESI